jgi:hypothetical protein
VATGVEGEQIGYLGMGGEFHGAGEIVRVLEQMAARALGDFSHGPVKWQRVRGRKALRVNGVNHDVRVDSRGDKFLDLRLNVMKFIDVDDEAGGHQHQNPIAGRFRQTLRRRAKTG